jgi:hypothetical protein
MVTSPGEPLYGDVPDLMSVSHEPILQKKKVSHEPMDD